MDYYQISDQHKLLLNTIICKNNFKTQVHFLLSNWLTVDDVSLVRRNHSNVSKSSRKVLTTDVSKMIDSKLYISYVTQPAFYTVTQQCYS